MCDYPFFIPQVVLFANSSLFWFKVTNEHREFRNYLNPKWNYQNSSDILTQKKYSRNHKLDVTNTDFY